jgi:nicotinamidase-related amidase
MSDQASVLDPKRTALLVMDFQQDVLRRIPGLEPLVARVQGAIADVLSDGTEDPDEQARDVLLGRIFPRRAQIIDTTTLRGLLSP